MILVIKYSAMKKILVFISVLLLISACKTTEEAKSSRIELRNDKKITNQAKVKEAVESKRYIIKLDKVYFARGGIVDLLPRKNYIIIDGTKAIISAAYLGRQYDSRPIAGINMHGITDYYKLTNNPSKGLYEIKMKVNNGNDSFDVYLRIGKNGSCNASISSLKIDNIRYRGYIVPIPDKQNNNFQEGELI